MLRDYINATIGFQRLTTDIDETSENIMRMLSTTGNPGLNNLMSQLVSDTDFLTPCELHFRFGPRKFTSGEIDPLGANKSWCQTPNF